MEHICSSIVNIVAFCYFLLTFAVIWDLHVDYIISAVGCIYGVTVLFVQGLSNNVKYMYTSPCGHIVDCTDFICGKYSDIAV